MVFLLPDLGYPVKTLWSSCSQILAIMLRHFGLLAPKDLDYLAFQSFDSLMTVIPETCRTQMRNFQRYLLPCFGSFVQVVSEETIQMLKVNK